MPGLVSAGVPVGVALFGMGLTGSKGSDGATPKCWVTPVESLAWPEAACLSGGGLVET